MPGFDLDDAVAALDQRGAVVDAAQHVVLQDRRLQRGGRVAEHHGHGCVVVAACFCAWLEIEPVVSGRGLRRHQLLLLGLRLLDALERFGDLAALLVGHGRGGGHAGLQRGEIVVERFRVSAELRNSVLQCADFV